MATHLPPLDSTEVIRCDFCSLVQFSPPNLETPCKRCRKSLLWTPEKKLALDAPPAPAPEPEAPPALASALRELRLKAGLSQRQMAAKLHCPRTLMSKWESQKCVPLLRSIQKIAAVLEVPIDELLQHCEHRRTESQAKLLSELVVDPFVAQILPFVSSLSELQKRTVMARISEMTQRASRVA